VELIAFPGNMEKEEAKKKDTERMAIVMFLRYTQQLHFLRTIRYNSVKCNQVLLKYDYMFQSKKTIIRPTLQKLLK